MKDDNGIKIKCHQLSIENFYLRVKCPLFRVQFNFAFCFLDFVQSQKCFSLSSFALEPKKQSISFVGVRLPISKLLITLKIWRGQSMGLMALVARVLDYFYLSKQRIYREKTGMCVDKFCYLRTY